MPKEARSIPSGDRREPARPIGSISARAALGDLYDLPAQVLKVNIHGRILPHCPTSLQTAQGNPQQYCSSDSG